VSREKKNSKKHKRNTSLWVVVAIITVLALVWGIIRFTASVECTAWKNGTENVYSKEEKIIDAVAVSYLVYGCECCDGLNGTVSEILDNNKMGILIENAFVSRTDPSDPATALINTEKFVREFIGDFRFLCDLKDDRCSFYGVALADDINKVIWVSYSGSVDFKDTLQCGLMSFGAGLSQQEKDAFKLYENVLETDEIKNGYQIILNGHSLGGGLASMVSYMSGAEAVTISGVDGIALGKIKSISKNASSDINISNYLTSPDEFGFSFMNCVQHVMFWGDYDGVECHTYKGNGLVDNSHSNFGFVRYVDGKLLQPVFTEEIHE